MKTIIRTIGAATLVAGTLDILSAFVWSGLTGSGPVAVLNSVAHGPFGNAYGGVTGALIGLIVHFVLMTVMAAVLVIAMSRSAMLRARPWIVGIAYGMIVYGVMYWIVLPLRWPTDFPQTEPIKVVQALISHIVCVGLPIALLARRMLARPA